MSAHRPMHGWGSLVGGALLWLAASGCGASDGFSNDSELGASPEDASDEEDGPHYDAPTVRIDILPSQLLNARGEFRALPRSTDSRVLEGDLDLGTLRLDRPAWFEGAVTAEQLTPYMAAGELPHVVQPLQGELSLRKAGSVQQYRTRLDADGIFLTEVVPHDLYDLVIVPDDPLVPMYLDELQVNGDPPLQELHLDLGAPLWGTVTDANGLPLAGAAVHARIPGVARTADAHTGSNGFFEIRVPPGHTFEVVTTGRDHGRDPVVVSEPVEVGEDGARLDLAYADLQPRIRGGTVLDASGNRLDGVKVHLTSESLAAYPEGTATHTVEAVTANGTFDVRLLAGTYRMELLPFESDNPALSPLVQVVEIVDGGPDFGTLTLPPLQAVQGVVVDPRQLPVADARVDCQDELGQKDWTTYTAEDGSYTLQLPQTPLLCTLTPPGARRQDLATTRLRFVGAGELMDPTLRFEEGSRVTGRVEHIEDGPESAAVIEVRDETGRLLGSTLTDADGAFSLRVAPPRQ